MAKGLKFSDVIYRRPQNLPSSIRDGEMLKLFLHSIKSKGKGKKLFACLKQIANKIVFFIQNFWKMSLFQNCFLFFVFIYELFNTLFIFDIIAWNNESYMEMKF